MAELELWGGPECTINRTADGFRDQGALSGHYDRLDDFDLFADLGLTALRIPLLWERIAPAASLDPDWVWADAALARLKSLDIRPIAGLVHHGSGPLHTDLLDDGFAAGLGSYAQLVAERYPWIEDWTPVNEPVTTARFSALYGHWYPHRHDEESFWRALLNQVDGVRAAMRAIRRVNPAARLIQTDDLGRTYATIKLAGQAAFDNLRRWAGWDLLFGRVTRHHPLWQRLDRLGLGDRLRAIADDPSPPDIIGINHYLTSDRFLDHRLQRYPERARGGNGRTAYADVEAVRVLDPAPQGLAGAVREAWQRYETPIAVTEVHNGCTREEQLRWACEAWDSAAKARAEGIDVRAVTAWSLLGSHDWNTLLTAPGGYEPGVFDMASGTPRRTALANLWRGLRSGVSRHPVATEPGWWRRPDRLVYPALPRPAGRLGAAIGAAEPAASPPLLICGATGTLGLAFARACAARGIGHVVTTRDTIDLNDPERMATALDALRPWGVINAAGWVRVDDAEGAEDECYAANATGAIRLAEQCAARGIGHLAFSSDLVFDGNTSRPYLESDRPRPVNAYGRSKAALEAGCAMLPGVLVIRTAAFFQAADPYNFVAAVLDTLAADGVFTAADDHVVTPTFVPALVGNALDLLIDGAAGIWHLSSGEALSWFEFAARVAAAAGERADRVRAVPGSTMDWRAPRPRYAALGSERGPVLGFLDRDIEQVVREYRGAAARVRAA